jgi:hypothetical protein
MASRTWWIRDEKGIEHPEDSVLLAYVRQQQLEDRLRIVQHIDGERCPRCRQKCSEFVQISATLDVLGHIAAYQHYPELPAAQAYVNVQRAVDEQNALQAFKQWMSNRQRPRRSAVRLISVPIAFGLALLFTVVMLVLASHGVMLVPQSSQGSVSPSQNNSTVVAPQFSTRTPDLTLTANASASATPTLSPTASPVPQGDIQVCSTHADIAQLHLVICGSNFVPGHQVSLVVIISGKAPIVRHPVLVNKQRDIQDGWYINNCKNVPVAIFAYDVTKQSVQSQVLQNISFAGCPTPTPVGGPPAGNP